MGGASGSEIIETPEDSWRIAEALAAHRSTDAAQEQSGDLDGIFADMDRYQRLAGATSGKGGLIHRFLTFLAGTDANDGIIADLTKTIEQYHPKAYARLRLVIGSIGLAGEAGEIADRIKKAAAHGHELDREALIFEAGDLFWYLAEIATALDVPLSEIARRNIEKLRARYPNGFSPEASINRVV